VNGYNARVVRASCAASDALVLHGRRIIGRRHRLWDRGVDTGGSYQERRNWQHMGWGKTGGVREQEIWQSLAMRKGHDGG
jgi:hypothetical protein